MHDVAKQLKVEPSARTAAEALLQAVDSKAMSAPSATEALKAGDHAARGVVVRFCSSRTQPGDRAAFEKSAQEAFGTRLNRDLRSALLLSFHKWDGSAGTPSNS